MIIMGTYEATNVLIARINNLDPENASKIIGHLLVSLQDFELIRLASSPDYVLRSIVFRVKSIIMEHSSAPSSPNPLPRPPPLPPTLPISSNPFSRFGAAHHHHPWPHSGFTNAPISPKFNPLIPHDQFNHGFMSKSHLSPRMMKPMVRECDTGLEALEEKEMNEYLSFLRDEDLGDSKLELLSHGNGDPHFHRRSYSTGDVCFRSEEEEEEEEEEEIGFKPCLYFSKGFCKNGRGCRFLHSDVTDSFGAVAGSPSSRFEGLEQHEELIRLKAAQNQRLMAMAAASPSSHDKYINFLMQQQNDSQRAAAAAFMTGEEFYKLGWSRQERNEFLAMLSADKHSPSSRQIYLTFPAESTFKDEDVSEYFSTFGPVHDVRIPYQQKRMFGFVTFVYPETVRHILSKGNPHFICDSRVLVKPYKEKGKLHDKRQQHQQQLEKGEFSPCLSPSGVDAKEPCDFHLGARMFYNPHEISLRRKLEQAELQRAIELQGRRLMNLHLPDFKNNPIRRAASLPISQLHSYISNPGFTSDNVNGDIAGFIGSPVSSVSLEPQQEVNPVGIHATDGGNGKESTDAGIRDIHVSAESVLPDSLSASPTKAAAGDNLSDFFAFSTSLSSSLNKLEPQTASGDMASH